MDGSVGETASGLSVLMMDTFSAVACSDYVETVAAALIFLGGLLGGMRFPTYFDDASVRE
jgi:hypothetical protein